jgi:ABC-type Zn2+ transport system substrate-binding protein/surface adhesin
MCYSRINSANFTIWVGGEFTNSFMKKIEKKKKKKNLTQWTFM